MSYSEIFLIIGPGLIIIIMGLFFWVFPIQYIEKDRPKSDDICDPTRYYSKNGISPWIIYSFSKEQWNYIQKIAPKTLIIFGILSACVSALIIFIFPLFDKSLLCTAGTVIFTMSAFSFIGIKAKRHKTEK